MTVRGLWLDDTPRRTLAPGYLERVRDAGYRSVSICTADVPDLGDEVPDWHPRWSTDQLRGAVTRCLELDLECSLMIWPVPRPAWLAAALPDLRQLVAIGIVALELDLESLWKSSRVRGYPSLAAAGEDLVTQLRRVTLRTDVRLDVTTHPAHGEAREGATVTPRCDRLYLQSYSTAHVQQGPRKGEAVPWTSRRGPGRCQLEDIAACPWRARLCIGLALWDQAWPGHEPAEAMQVAEDAALAAWSKEIRWWSAKHRTT